MYESIVLGIVLAILGATLGSFGAATVWRLRARQLVADQKEGEPVDKKELKRLKPLVKGAFGMKDHSRCLHCGYELKWYDLIPIISWVTLRGKCRNCHTKIGWFELLMEVGVALFFVGSYLLWPGGLDSGLAVAHFSLWLAAGFIMAMLFAYDAKWYLLPNVLTLALAVVGLAIVGVATVETQDVGGTLLSALGAVLVLSGLYAVLYVVSKGRWVGFGDVKLGFGLGLILIDWQLALAALFLANFIGCLIVIPLMVTKKLQPTSHIPFGPLLIAGAVLAWFIGWPVIEGYLAIIGI